MKIKVTGGPSGIRYKVTLDFRGYDDENFSDNKVVDSFMHYLSKHMNNFIMMMSPQKECAIAILESINTLEKSITEILKSGNTT